MNPSQVDIAREVEALRDLKRRSATQGALTIDPDLPSQSTSTPSAAAYWSGAVTDGQASTSAHDDLTKSEADDSIELDFPDNPADDPFHLFWVPASVHPEIAPAEFRAFLKEHARAPSADGSEPLSRTNSTSSLASFSSGLGRKKSMLSRQYKPTENDGVEEETVVPLKRSRSSMYGNRGPQLTISDLQKLEELAEEASDSDDPSKLRRILRRSLSLNMSPTALENMEGMTDAEEADVPIIVPPPGQILRRAARTKIRKPGLPGDGGGHRFGASRRGGTRHGSDSISAPTDQRMSSDRSSSDHGDSVESDQPHRSRVRTFSNESINQQRPDSFSEETSIFDAYVRDEDETEVPLPSLSISTSPPHLTLELPKVQLEESGPVAAQVKPELLEAIGPVLAQPQPQKPPELLRPPQSPNDFPSISRSPSPSEISTTSSEIVQASPPPPFLSSPPQSRKDKKGLFGKWGSDKNGKRAAKEKERENRERSEKESGFFGSIFGGKKRDSENVPPPIGGLNGSTTGREAAHALLGASKSSRSYNPPPSPNSQLPPGVNNWSRYPIHVERAIYRLSHIKLANPRRPLYEQVLISNLMFWYLGVINKAQTAPGSPPDGQTNGQPVQTEQQKKEQEQREREQQENAEKERLEKESAEKERLEREQREKRDASPRRAPLNKVPPAGQGGRRSEMAVKGPSYEMQHRVIEQEYGYSYSGQNMGRSTTAPPSNSPRQAQPYPNQPRNALPPEQQSPDNFYYAADAQPTGRLPPGAMPPVELSNWQNAGPRPNSTSPPPSDQRSRSPPNYRSDNTIGGGRPGRSLSATVIPSPHVNGKIRKGTSASAAIPTGGRRPHSGERGGVGEEEDVPLAVWQQQRRR